MEEHLEKNDLHWHAPEFEYREKGELWYLGVIVLSAAAVFFALWQKNYLFAIFAGIAAVLLLSWGKRFPSTLKFSIEGHGVRIDALKFLPWTELEYFAINAQERELSEIILKKKSRGVVPFVRIHAYTDELDAIRERLAKHLEEREYEESFADSLERIIGF
ncbi:MAG: hypothetical protein HYT14_01660 [Candidatus Liptonbacteria bacterium]|nr:hypothetical protein [Candidatus Liptonbacteria bacterium]